MAAVAQSGEDLIRDIDTAEAPHGQGLFWWLGQHSFVVKLGATVLYIDPYLQPDEDRQTPPLLDPRQITNADFVLCTHDHLDHIDPYAIAGIVNASPNALFAAPNPHRQRMLEIGVPEDRLQLFWPEQGLGMRGVQITGVKAKHEFFDESRAGFPYLGYIIEGNGVCCYHPGDTLIYEGLLTTLQRRRIDAAFLPINGRDAVRYLANCLGNMTFQEAVDLAGELEVGLAVPTHWDMFATNSEDPRKFVDYLAAKFPKVKSWLGPAGERVRFEARSLPPGMVINLEQLSQAREIQQRTGADLGKVLEEQGVNPFHILQAKAHLAGMRAVDLAKHQPDAGAVSLLPAHIALRHRVVPLTIIRDQAGQDVLVIAMADASDIPAVDELRMACGIKIQPVLASADQIAETLASLYGDSTELA